MTPAPKTPAPKNPGLLPPPPDPAMDFTKPAAPVTAAPVAAPVVAAPPPPPPVAATTPAQIPVPMKAQLGLPDVKEPDYSQAMDWYRGRLPDPKAISEAWNTPQAKSAAEQFHNAIMANFYSASGDANSMTMFFQSNPYAYMLGQSAENISRVITAKTNTEAKDDPLINQFATPSIIMDTAAMMQGKDNVSVGMPYGFAKETQMYHDTVLRPWLDSLYSSGLGRVGNYIMAQANGLKEKNASLISAYANDKGARAGLMDAETRQAQHLQNVREYEEVGKDKTQAEAASLRAQADMAYASGMKQREEAKLVRPSAMADIAYKKAYADLARTQSSTEYGKLELQGLELTERRDQNDMNAASLVAQGYFTQSQVYQQSITEYTKNGAGYVAATQDDVKAGKAATVGQRIPDATLQGLIDAKKTYDAMYFNQCGEVEKITSTIRDRNLNASPVFQARMASVWLSRAASNNFDTTEVARDVASSSDPIIKSQYFPPTPMAWDPTKNCFKAYTGIKPEDAIPVAYRQQLFSYMYGNPAILDLIRKGQVFSPKDWAGYCQQVNSKMQQTNPGTPPLEQSHYRDYIVMCNYVKQTDHLIQQYRLASQAHTPFTTYMTQNDDLVDAPQIAIPAGTASPPAPRPSTKNGGKK